MSTLALLNISMWRFWSCNPLNFDSKGKQSTCCRLQPVRDTREKQIQLWKELILSFCKHHGVFVVDIDDFPLFTNKSIESKQPYDRSSIYLQAGLTVVD
jgi:hypothetical protein